MRHFILAAGLTFLSLCASPPYANAFDLEEQRIYVGSSDTPPLRILSTADIEVFEPIIERFQKLNPTVAIQYDVASTREVMRAIYKEGIAYDLVISSAMDLQTKLANDGFAQGYSSEVTLAMPRWARWRDRVFAFTQEPAVLIISEEAFRTLPVPSNRRELIELLRDHGDSLEGKVGTYDIRSSGFGYLMATQDSRNSDAFWRLTEIMGRLDTKLYCCSGQMIADVANGRLALAYNVLGSYSASSLARTPGVRIVELNDFVSVMLRTALIPNNADQPEGAGRMIDFLTRLSELPDLAKRTGLPPIAQRDRDETNRIRPIRLGPELLVFLDTLRREQFLANWTSAIIQTP